MNKRQMKCMKNILESILTGVFSGIVMMVLVRIIERYVFGATAADLATANLTLPVTVAAVTASLSHMRALRAEE